MEKSPIKTLLNSWPSRATLAAEIGASVDQVHKWAQAGRIPSRWQASVVEAAQRRDLEHVTCAWMLRAHAGERHWENTP